MNNTSIPVPMPKPVRSGFVAVLQPQFTATMVLATIGVIQIAVRAIETVGWLATDFYIQDVFAWFPKLLFVLFWVFVFYLIFNLFGPVMKSFLLLSPMQHVRMTMLLPGDRIYVPHTLGNKTYNRTGIISQVATDSVKVIYDDDPDKIAIFVDNFLVCYEN